MHVEVVLAALVLVVAVLVAADFFRRTSDGPHEYVEGQAHEAGRETFPVSRAGSTSSVSSFVRPNWLVRTRLGLLAVVSAAAAALATGGIIHAAGAFQRASAQSNVSPSHDGAVVSAILALVFAVAVLAAGLRSATILIRSVVRPLHQLRAGAVEGRPLAVKAVGVSALDEIGDVARAFDQVQGEVLRLAGQEAGLRGKLSEMFAELSGRGQSLMEHQLRLIDELGQGEQDAGRRASLVTMNRLAARMRRHSQNLLVLAGQELPGRWDRPVLLVDVIRAAVAQAGERERVLVSVQPDIAVSGPAVNDVVHLVAELAENAASLSATDTPVDISGGTLATGGVLLEVTDQGVGMNPEMMAKANWRLEHPPPVDAAVSRHMGLLVVGTLAARHGIKVRLQPAATGGLTALVWLPDPIIVLPGPIIVLPEADALAGFAPAEPEAQARHARSPGGPRATWRLRAPAPGQAAANGRRLPIYEAVESDWFSSRRKPPGGATAAADGWEAPVGSGWDAARIVLAPASSGVTTAGLPVRAPRANLVPGAIGSPGPDDSGPVRSADAARNRLAGFQRGASQGRAASSHDGRDPAP
jgi:signal transduction histidine kinase